MNYRNELMTLSSIFDGVIISGLNTHHKSFAHAVVAENSVSSNLIASQEEQDSLEQCLTNFIAVKTGIKVENSEVSACHALIAKEARKLCKDKKISSTWSRDCHVFIHTLGSPETSQIKVIHSTEELDNFTRLCYKMFQITCIYLSYLLYISVFTCSLLHV